MCCGSVACVSSTFTLSSAKQRRGKPSRRNRFSASTGGSVCHNSYSACKNCTRLSCPFVYVRHSVLAKEGCILGLGSIGPRSSLPRATAHTNSGRTFSVRRGLRRWQKFQPHHLWKRKHGAQYPDSRGLLWLAARHPAADGRPQRYCCVAEQERK